MSDKFTEEFERIEVHWFYRHLETERDKKIKRMTILQEPAGKMLSPSEQKEFDKLQGFIDDFNTAIKIIGEQKAASHKHKYNLLAEKEILEEAIELNEYQTAVDAAKEKLAELQVKIDAAEKIKLTFSRGVIRFAINLINDDLTRFRTKLIPAYEKAKDADFTDPVFTRIYYINKVKKSKKILETFKKKLEKGL